MLPPLFLCPSLCTPWLALDLFIPVTRYHLPSDFTHRLLCYQVSGRAFIHFLLTTYKWELPIVVMVIKLASVCRLNRFFQKQIWSHRCPVWTLLCVETPVDLHHPLLRSLNSLNDRRIELSPYLCHILPSAGLFSLVQTTPFPDNFQLLFVIWLLPSQSVGYCHRPSKSLGCSLSPDVNS